ncbi:MAG TPA: hypothetical protein VF476_14145 [Chitinophagaceae bacterium]
MKKSNWLILCVFAIGTLSVPVSCKSKKKDVPVEENKKSDAPVIVSPDASLRQSVDNVLGSYNSVSADVKDGVVTLRGNIKRDDLQTLMMKIQELRPRKVENQLVIT